MRHILLSATALVLIQASAAMAQSPPGVPAIQADDANKPVTLTRNPPPPASAAAATAAAPSPGSDAVPNAPPASVVAPATQAAPRPQTTVAAAAPPVTPASATPVVNVPVQVPASPAPVDLGAVYPTQVPPEAGPPGQSGQATQPQFPMVPPPAVNPINQAPVGLSWKERRGIAISRAWRERNAAPATGDDGAVKFTFGATQPTIVCAPLTVCLVKLEHGERVLPDGLQLGDKTRWHVTPALAADQTVLTIKPSDAALDTTLAVMTDRRVYSIRLVSVASEARSMPISEFDYPDEDAARMSAYQAQVQQQASNNTLPGGRPISSLDFQYSISGDNPAWRPERVYSDGIHTFIMFPDAIRSSDTPSLLALAHDGTWFSNPTGQVINYRREGNTYVVDRVIDRAELIVGVGDGQSRVVITHQGRAS